MIYTSSKKILGIGFILSLFFLFGCSSKQQDDASIINVEKLAQCMGEKGVKMYGTETCSHCIAQKDMFGDSFKYINYVDCTKTPDVCSKIQGTPTREFSNGELLPGKQMLSVLAEKSDCEIK